MQCEPTGMRILYVQPAYFDPASYIGGGERYPLNLARAVVLASGGTIKIAVASFGRQSKQFSVTDRIEMHVFAGSSRNGNMFDATSPAIIDLINTSDIVHVFQPFTRGGEVASLACMLRGVPVVLTDLGALTSRVGEQSGLVNMADGLICISKFSAARFHLYRHRRHIVASGPYDDTKFKLCGSDGIREPLLYVGRIMPHKGIDSVVQALPPGLPLIICGRPYEAKYFALLKRLARGKDVTFVTDADDRTLIQLYRSALAVILPSVHFDVYGKYHPYPELLGLTLLEGAASGCFAICRKVGGMPEFLGDAQCGASFESDNELCGLLSSIIAHKDTLSCSAAVRKRAHWAMQTHGLRATGDRVLKVYEQLYDERRG